MQRAKQSAAAAAAAAAERARAYRESRLAILSHKDGTPANCGLVERGDGLGSLRSQPRRPTHGSGSNFKQRRVAVAASTVATAATVAVVAAATTNKVPDKYTSARQCADGLGSRMGSRLVCAAEGHHAAALGAAIVAEHHVRMDDLACDAEVVLRACRARSVAQAPTHHHTPCLCAHAVRHDSFGRRFHRTFRSCQEVSKARLPTKTFVPASAAPCSGLLRGGGEGNMPPACPLPRPPGAGNPGSAASRSSRTKMERVCRTES